MKFILCFILLSSLHGRDWDDILKVQSDEEAAKWLKETIVKAAKDSEKYDFEEIRSRTEKIVSENRKPCKDCHAAGLFPENPQLFVFVSFSMPDEALLELSNAMLPEKGVFVLRGLPPGGFFELQSKLASLKKKGLKSSVQIYPQIFEKYSVDAVPTFIVCQGDKFDKITGNISLRVALELIQNKGETGLKMEEFLK